MPSVTIPSVAALGALLLMFVPGATALAQTNYYIDCGVEVNGGGALVVAGSRVDPGARAINLQFCGTSLASGSTHAVPFGTTPAQLSADGYVEVCAVSGGPDAQLFAYAWSDLADRSMVLSWCQATPDQTLVTYYAGAPQAGACDSACQARVLAILGAPPWLIDAITPPSPPQVSPNDQYQTVNGVRTAAQMQNELVKAGYQGPFDVPSVLAAYQRTTKSPVTAL